MVTDLEERQPAPKGLQSEVMHTAESRLAGAGGGAKLLPRSGGWGGRGGREGLRPAQGRKPGAGWGVGVTLGPPPLCSTHHAGLSVSRQGWCQQDSPQGEMTSPRKNKSKQTKNKALKMMSS